MHDYKFKRLFLSFYKFSNKRQTLSTNFAKKKPTGVSITYFLSQLTFKGKQSLETVKRTNQKLGLLKQKKKKNPLRVQWEKEKKKSSKFMGKVVWKYRKAYANRYSIWKKKPPHCILLYKHKNQNPDGPRLWISTHHCTKPIEIDACFEKQKGIQSRKNYLITQNA